MKNRTSILHDAASGAIQLSPILVGIVPFAIITGATLVHQGLTQAQAIIMSLLVFEGVTTLVAVGLMHADLPVGIILITGALICLRYNMYSAAFAPHIRHAPLWQRIVGSYWLSDQAYATSAARYKQAEPVNKIAFYSGAACILYIGWQGGIVFGALLGSSIPHDIPLNFAIPLTFMALLIPFLDTIPHRFAAVGAGLFSLAGNALPYGLAITLGTVFGVLVGFFIQRRWYPELGEDAGKVTPPEVLCSPRDKAAGKCPVAGEDL